MLWWWPAGVDPDQPRPRYHGAPMILIAPSTPGRLSCSLEAADALAHRTTAPRGRWLMPLLQMLIGAAVMVAHRVERLND